ncbi:hypothetical protein MIMGU_mgv1a026362mg [Erythranthe guttata]|uniref:FAD-binding PCMH-type domain-containing protein n=1 Tax=Erythranthe guttata TaxID=4155 RepID=A0A022RT27_ERYGU|nr:PREDICTED: reticuline oxidase-like protein [Erythranthe guttata]EYU43214.1 hypothetical protein MIMGU_mgv1a026362mg [Erythranthe guttata]|eukprot:XP_012830441.1 PREDICTED: reticuline oxidase-like protein [Erythranthe guttata]
MRIISFSLTILQLLLLSSFFSSIATSQDNFFKCLSSNNIGDDDLPKITYMQSNINYTNILQEYIRNGRFINTTNTPKPTLILTPFQESQVQAIVNCAKNVNLHLKIRSGGHDYEGLSYMCKAPFAILDMFNLRSIQVNMKDETAWVQAGSTLGELYHKIWENSKVHGFPSGVCPTVGVGGHISGGGYGTMIRKYGLSVDHVVDARIVVANGSILDRASMGEDLFWAIRGGGGASFGVVLSYKINLVPVPEIVTVFRVPRTLEQNAVDLVYRWQNIAPQLENELFIRVYIQTVNTTGNSKITLRTSFIAMYLGDSDKLVSIMNKKFPELGLKKEDCKEMSWIKSILFWGEFPDTAIESDLLSRKALVTSAFKMKSDYVKTPISRGDLGRIYQKLISSGNIWMAMNAYGGMMSEVADTETAFPHRVGNIYKIQYLTYWNETGPDSDKANIQSIRNFYDFMTPFVSKNPREAFLNYRDIDIGSTDNVGPNAYSEARVYGEKYFKGNFDRLVQVKTKVDPTNFFRNEQSIPVLIKN